MKAPQLFTAYWCVATGLACLFTYFYYAHNHSQGMGVLATGFFSVVLYGGARLLLSLL
jgi:hypothetical protein